MTVKKRIWIVTRPGVASDRHLRLFAAFCVRQAQILLNLPNELGAACELALGEAETYAKTGGDPMNMKRAGHLVMKCINAHSEDGSPLWRANKLIGFAASSTTDWDIRQGIAEIDSLIDEIIRGPKFAESKLTYQSRESVFTKGMMEMIHPTWDAIVAEDGEGGGGEAKMENVVCTDGNDLVNRTLAMPVSIHTDDGRQLLLTSWEPLVTVGEVVTVKMEAHVVVPKSWKEGKAGRREKPEDSDLDQAIALLIRWVALHQKEPYCMSIRTSTMRKTKDFLKKVGCVAKIGEVKDEEN